MMENNYYIDPLKADPFPIELERIPYLVGISGKNGFSAGILISPNHVIAPASFIMGSNSVQVHLGFREDPQTSTTDNVPHTEIISSKKIVRHDAFVELVPGEQYINNIAIIHLAKTVTLSDTIRPGKLISEEEALLLEARPANLTGWSSTPQPGILVAPVLIRNKETCRLIFGEKFLGYQHICIKWLASSRLGMLGNPITVGEKIIGFKTLTPMCKHTKLKCSEADMVLSFTPYLNWMSRMMKLPIEGFTSDIVELAPKNCDSSKLKILKENINMININIAKHSKDLEDSLEEVFMLKNITEFMAGQLQDFKQEQEVFSMMMNRQIDDIKINIYNMPTVIHDQNECLPNIRNESGKGETGGVETGGGETGGAETGDGGKGGGQRVTANIKSLSNTISNIVESNVNKQEFNINIRKN